VTRQRLPSVSLFLWNRILGKDSPALSQDSHDHHQDVPDRFLDSLYHFPVFLFQSQACPDRFLDNLLMGYHPPEILAVHKERYPIRLIIRIFSYLLDEKKDNHNFFLSGLEVYIFQKSKKI
jgi:hypothetical protein